MIHFVHRNDEPKTIRDRKRVFVCICASSGIQNIYKWSMSQQYRKSRGKKRQRIAFQQVNRIETFCGWLDLWLTNILLSSTSRASCICTVHIQGLFIRSDLLYRYCFHYFRFKIHRPCNTKINSNSTKSSCTISTVQYKLHFGTGFIFDSFFVLTHELMIVHSLLGTSNDLLLFIRKWCIAYGIRTICFLLFIIYKIK